jgi:hypothetical protein
VIFGEEEEATEKSLTLLAFQISDYKVSKASKKAAIKLLPCLDNKDFAVFSP